MKRIFAYIILVLLPLAAGAEGFIPMGKATLRQLQPRDSILVADQLEYGFELDSLKAGTEVMLQDYSEYSNDTLTLVRNWQLDTLGAKRHKKSPEFTRLRANVILAPFEEGTYRLPDIGVLLKSGEHSDTLVFEGLEIDVKTIPIDTATFEVHDIKPQIRYPVTPEEVFPYVAGLQLLALVTALVVSLLMVKRRKKENAGKSSEPPYIVALRNLEKYRGDRYWAPEKQKTLYSGITDTLRTYIESRFDINAEEMTTAEIFEGLKSSGELTPEQYSELKDLFETADFVKFAKLTVGDEENAKAVPTAVRFVTSTYQTQLEEEAEKAADGGEAAGK